MSIYEVRCHVCGGMLDGHHMEYNMGVSKSPFAETCSQKCHDIYYSDPDGDRQDDEDGECLYVRTWGIP